MKTNYWIKKYKYKFYQKQLYRLKGVTNRNFIAMFFYSSVLKNFNSKFLLPTQIEAARKIIRHFIKKFIKIYINLVCDKSLSAKSSGVRMGKGKGNLNEWVKCLKVGSIIFTLLNLNMLQSKFLLSKASKKFNFKTNSVYIDLKRSNFLKKNLYY